MKTLTIEKVTRGDINKEKFVALSYCQCQTSLGLFASELKIGYNSGAYGWNYDLYDICGWSVTTGYRMPYEKYSNKELKNKLVKFENKLRKMEYAERQANIDNLRFEFFECFR